MIYRFKPCSATGIRCVILFLSIQLLAVTCFNSSPYTTKNNVVSSRAKNTFFFKEGDQLSDAAGNFVRDLTAAAAATAVCLSTAFLPLSAFAADDSTSGFEEFAAQGGTMKANPSCFFDECKEQTQNCFTNPACLKGITCLGNCRGEQLCATQCFARFGSERLNAWLGCTLEEKECVTTGVKQDTTKYYANPPPAMPSFKPSDLEGKWYKVLGYNPKYDTYPCQTNTFELQPNGGLKNDILFRVPKPDGGTWQNNFLESMENSKGPEGKASMTVEGKMFGLTFHEQWYVLGKGDDFVVVSYIGDTQQGPYDGAFVYTKTKDALESNPKIRRDVDNIMTKAGLDPSKLVTIDNACPPDATAAGASLAESSKEKLEWKDVFELTEWFRPGTLKKDSSFNPNSM
eukprot:CAMPEP_0178926170 /NCGR_PEP_ID=MMETSP0786-20121207/18362_1 /TAXON_ID=186022 /ORGANISM="Thalassionema frauenfeldii, Strain CCMP 1798" /LENGTH=400 /DNA_ID=CAMNT_0020601219 /DNA_START=19 /DNA_END=1221 /DNA_ORIENTATION=-